MRVSWRSLLVPMIALACESSSGNPAQISLTPEGAGPHCTHGGVAVLSTSGDGTASTSYLCNGAPGANGSGGTSPVVIAIPASDTARCPAGKGGIEVQVGTGSPLAVCTGADGLGATITPLAVGDSHCPGGGLAVRVGSGAPAYTCDGQSAIVTPLASGDASCPTGGVKLQVGSATPAYACNGSLVWSTISSDGTAAANNGYISRSAAPITLVVAASSTFEMGDRVRVLVDGAGSVRVAPAAGQSFRFDGQGLSMPTGWSTTGAPSAGWTGLASSADGTRLVAAVFEGGIHVSTDSGATWTKTSAPDMKWRAVASSADGTRLAAVVFGGRVYSSGDSGVTWIQSDAPTRYWYTVASSSEGLRMVAGCAGGIYLSSDGGATWTSSGVGGDWGAVASSGSGATLLASTAGGAGEVWASKDYGATWTKTSAPGGSGWSAVGSSFDGTRLIAASSKVGVWTSADGGSTWMRTSLSGSVSWQGVATSADGTRLVACSYPGTAHVSTDAGATWTATAFPASGCQMVAASATGSRVFAALNGAGIYRTGTGELVAHEWSALELTYVGGGSFFISDVIGTVEAP